MAFAQIIGACNSFPGIQMVPDSSLRFPQHPPKEKPPGLFDHMSKVVATVVPSVIATVTAAYIVTHYVNSPPSPPPEASAAVKSSEKSVPSSEDAARPSASVGNRPASKPRAPGRASSTTESQAPVVKDPAVPAAASAPEVIVTPPSEPVRKVSKHRIEPHRMSAPPPAPLTETHSAPVVEAPPPASPAPDALSLARGALDRIKAEESKSGQGQENPVAESPPPAAQATSIAKDGGEGPRAAAPKDESRVLSEPMAEVPALPPPVIIADPIPAVSVPAHVDPVRQPQRRVGGAFDDHPIPPAEIPGKPY